SFLFIQLKERKAETRLNYRIPYFLSSRMKLLFTEMFAGIWRISGRAPQKQKNAEKFAAVGERLIAKREPVRHDVVQFGLHCLKEEVPFLDLSLKVIIIE